MRSDTGDVIGLADGFDVRAEIRQDGLATWVDLHVPSGHVPPSARADVVDAVFGLLEQLRRRGRRFASPAAGSTCLVDAEFDLTTG